MFAIGIFALFGLGIVAIGGLIVWVIIRSTRSRTPVEQMDEKTSMMAEVRSKVHSLSPWRSSLDVSAAMQFNYVKAFSRKLWGTIYSPERNAIIAFDRVERGFASNGYMFAASTAFELYYEINVDEFAIMYNGQWFGRITKAGHIINAQGQTIGQAVHPEKVAFNIGRIEFRTGENKFQLFINGRVLATIWVSPDYSGNPIGDMSIIFNENNWGQSIVQLHDQPTEDEERWLSVFATLEVAFHGHWLI